MSGPEAASSSSSPVTPTVPIHPAQQQQQQQRQPSPVPPPAPPVYVPPKPQPPKTPPKPILKRPKAQPQTFLSFTRNILSISSKFLPPQPTQPTNNDSAVTQSNGTPVAEGDKALPAPLKRAHFIVNHMSTTYPISSQAPPSMPGLTDAIREIEEREFERRQREDGDGNLTLQRIEDLYRECCRSRDEQPLLGVVGAIRHSNTIAPRTLDLTGIRLTAHAAAALADALAVEWGVRRLLLRDCDLDDGSLKPILHSLLITRTLPYLSICANRRLKTSSFQLIGVYAQKANTLQFLDLSENILDKKSVEYIVVALGSAPPSFPSSSDLNGSSTPSTPLASERSHLPNSPPSAYFQHRSLTSSSGVASPPPDWVPPSGFSTPSILPSKLVGTQHQVNGKSDGLERRNTLDSVSSGPAPSSPALSFSSLSLTHSISPYDRRRPRQGSVISLSVGLSVPPPSQVISLRLDECSLRGSNLEALAQAVRPSSLRHLSLRQNRIGPQGSVALALMIKDYPDSGSIGVTPANLLPPGSPQPVPSTPTNQSAGQQRRGSGFTSGSSSPSRGPTPSLPNAGSQQPPPPPRHPATVPQPLPQTTYTPYIPRSKRNMVVSQPASTATSPLPSPAPSVKGDEQRQVPVITSSRAGGVTSARPPPLAPSRTTRQGSIGPTGLGINMITSPGAFGSTALSRREEAVKLEGHSAALLDKVRSLDSLPRLGALQTLDLKGNDIRNGVSYLAQVLKRNRTLKVLNLSENKIDVQGLVAIAEALKYNSTLETLDMSRNPCCGPGIEGIMSIRTAFTLNTSLKRLFLSGTNLSSSGAICLAEFLPEARALLHLDLTQNTLDIAGVMALSVGIKMNETIRCLDVNVPPNDAEFSRLSREILRWCVRNTERAAAAGAGGASVINYTTNGSSSLNDVLGFTGTGASRGGVWGLIEKSEIAKVVKEEAERERLGQETKERGSVSGQEKLDVWKKTPSEVLRAAKDCAEDLQLLIGGILPSDRGHKERLVERAQVLVSVIGEMVPVESNADTLQELLTLNDELLELVKRVKKATEASLTLSFANGDLNDPNRFDYKGKGRATPQDELPPDDLGYPAVIDNMLQAGAEAGERNGTANVAPSPVERSRLWVVEEGEIFRKGQVLLGPNIGEEDAEVTSDELRLELLEAQVERPRHRIIDEAVNVSGETTPPNGA